MPWEGKNSPFTTGNTVSYWIESQIHSRQHSCLSKYLLRRQVLGLESEIGISVVSPHSQCATALQFDQVERRFLLSGGKQGSIAIHDFEKESLLSSSALSNSLEPKKLSAVRSAPLANNDFHSISTVQWYPADSGVFLAGNLSGRFCLFDTNAFAPVFSLHFRGRKLFTAKFHNNSTHSTLHSCIALGLDEGEALLVDPRVGDRPIAHLQTHARGSAVNSVEWHTAIGGFDFQLLTAGDDGAVRLWDIRSLASASSTQRTPLLSLDWTNDHTFSSSSPQQDQNPSNQSHRSKQTQNTIASRAASVTAHAGAKVKRALFTPCGRHILSVGEDAALRLWQVSSGRHLTEYHYEIPTRGLAFTGSINFPLVLWSQPHTEELLCVLPVSQSLKSSISAGRVPTRNMNNASLAIYPVYGASGRPVRFLQSGHLQGPITDVAINCNNANPLCGIKDAAMVTSAADGLILLWQAPFAGSGAQEDDDTDEDTMDNHKKTASSTRAPVSVRNSARRIESRYEFERDVLQRHFNSDNNNSNSSAVPNDLVVVIGNNNCNINNSTSNNKERNDSGNKVAGTAADVQVYQLESCNKRFLPSILRTYLQQARFHNQRISQVPPEITRNRLNLRTQHENVANEEAPMIDWNEVDAILRNASDEEEDDANENIRRPEKMRRIMTKDSAVDKNTPIGIDTRHNVWEHNNSSKEHEQRTANCFFQAPGESVPQKDLFGGISDSDSESALDGAEIVQPQDAMSSGANIPVVEYIEAENYCDTPSSLTLAEPVNFSNSTNSNSIDSKTKQAIQSNSEKNTNNNNNNPQKKQTTIGSVSAGVSKEALKRMQRLRKK